MTRNLIPDRKKLNIQLFPSAYPRIHSRLALRCSLRSILGGLRSCVDSLGEVREVIL
ncbi:hypothetical protein [Pseudomonas phage vB_PaeP_PS28]|nr:hypothetical protein [Pseudomonas phage vB_PaeP_PS28]